MGIFNVELKKVVDDSYKIEIGFHLEDTLINDLKNGLVGNISKFALITDSIVENLYAKDILERLKKEGYTAYSCSVLTRWTLKRQLNWYWK